MLFTKVLLKNHEILFVFYTHDRDGVLRVFSNFRFLSCRSPIGTARHLFSRSVNGTSSGSSTSWINARIGRAKPPVTSVLQDIVSSLDEVVPFPRWLTIASLGCVVFFSSLDDSCCSFGEASSSKEFWKETEQRLWFCWWSHSRWHENFADLI